MRIANEVLLARWERYCNDNWLSEGSDAPNSREGKIKKFLGDIGYLLLRDNPEDTLSTYKEMARGRSEIPVSSCPACVGDLLYGDGGTLIDKGGVTVEAFQDRLMDLDEKAAKHGVRPTAKAATVTVNRSSRISAIRMAHPSATFSFSRVDTDNQFVHDGRTYQIDQSVAAYSAKQTKEGLLFDMDQVMIVSTDCEMAFFDQDAFPIDDMLVHKIMDDPSEKERDYAKGKRESNRTSSTQDQARQDDEGNH